MPQLIPPDSPKDGHLPGVKKTISLSPNYWLSNTCDLLPSINTVHSTVDNKVNQRQGTFREKCNFSFDNNDKFLFVYSNIKTNKKKNPSFDIECYKHPQPSFFL